MALLFWDGFDHYNSVADLQSRAGIVQYTILSGGPVTGRNGNGKAWQGQIGAILSQRLASQFFGASVVNTGDLIIYIDDSVTAENQLIVYFRASNYSIEIWRGNGFNTLLHRTANNVWTADTANFIEVWPVIDSSSGSVKVQVNHELLVNISGQNTQATTNAWYDEFVINGGTVDDLYYCDTTTGPGTNPCNDFLGDPRVYTQFPTANAAVAWTPLANTNWQEVSEQAFDGDASYNYSSNIGDVDLFNIGPVPTTITGILGFQTTVAARKDDAGLRQINVLLKSSSAQNTGAARNLTDTNYVYWSEQAAVDPNTSASWTRSGVNAAEIGYKMAA